MTVTDDEVAALRALLHGDSALFHEIRGRRDRSRSTASYVTFLMSAFMNAVERRFGKDSTEEDVINYVAAVRSEDEEIGGKVDPRAAERVIMAVLNDEGAEDVDAQTKGGIFIVFVAALIRDEQLDDPGLEEFLAKARKRADGFLATLDED